MANELEERDRDGETTATGLRARRGRPPKGWQDKFIESMADTGNFRYSCDQAMVHRSTVYRHLERDEDLAKRLEEARLEAGDLLEREAFRRGVIGIDEPVFGKLPGKDSGNGVIGMVRKYDTKILIELLRANLPDKYGTQRIEQRNIDGTADALREEAKRLVGEILARAAPRNRPKPLEQ